MSRIDPVPCSPWGSAPYRAYIVNNSWQEANILISPMLTWTSGSDRKNYPKHFRLTSTLFKFLDPRQDIWGQTELVYWEGPHYLLMIIQLYDGEGCCPSSVPTFSNTHSPKSGDFSHTLTPLMASGQHQWGKRNFNRTKFLTKLVFHFIKCKKIEKHLKKIRSGVLQIVGDWHHVELLNAGRLWLVDPSMWYSNPFNKAHVSMVISTAVSPIKFLLYPILNNLYQTTHIDSG